MPPTFLIKFGARIPQILKHWPPQKISRPPLFSKVPARLIIPITKQQLKHADYRPISFLSTSAKTPEKIIHHKQHITSQHSNKSNYFTNTALRKEISFPPHSSTYIPQMYLPNMTTQNSRHTTHS